MTQPVESRARSVVPLLYHLLDAPELNCASPNKLRVLWPIMAEDAARALQEPRLARVRPSTATYKRWLAGTHIPRGDLRTILEAYFGKKVEALFQLVPARDIVRPRPLDRRTRTAVRQSLDYTWPTSRHVPGEPDAGIFGSWELTGGRHFDGTSIGVQIYEAEPRGDVMEISSADLPHLETFVRSSRRGVILASPGAAGGSGLYVMDAALARQDLFVGQDPRVPLAYQLDDLVYAMIWALHVMDDGLLADDNPLSDRAEQLRHYVRISNSAPPRSEMPDLSPIGAAWLGSSLCAQYIVRHLGDLPEVPAFWTREATGEECAPWLLFRHKHDYLQKVADRFAGPGSALGRAFCVPESVVRSSEVYERILLFLAIAMMEMYGVKVWLSAEQEFQEVEGFVLARNQAILANWVREESVWRVATTSTRREVAPYQEVIDHARAHSLVDGPTPTARLRALADYLGLDWTWLVGRCQDLAEEGLTRMLRPRSRLLTLTALDETLRFICMLGGPHDGR
ncbi:transcriptional regulator, XRE family protein [Streptomyces sp. MZ04]|uniref:transcriptional regulator, XRE family protein n=1 Tax=Streptomyces sp. MZ04 TaxID=2559236 RepID=UPI00107EB794|nr:transcriptional regulator, XRE family protein [Streptomyces sp. MZ04]TGB15544.1 transcriptional regulator, XRE family protein [Streptomyces sp. MZ04]